MSQIIKHTHSTSERLPDEHNSLFVTYLAAGGWDTLAFCDPKSAPYHQGYFGEMSHYHEQDIRHAGAIRYAPAAKGYSTSHELNGLLDQFFARFHQSMVVVNGVVSDSQSQQDAQLLATSGTNQYQLPSLSSLFATAHNHSSIHYDCFTPNCLANNSHCLGYSDLHSLGDATNELHINSSLSRRATVQQLTPLFEKKLGWKATIKWLKQNPNPCPASLVSHAFAMNLANSATIVGGSFHSTRQSDRHQNIKYLQLLNDLILLWNLAEEFGFADRLTVYMCSEFGRTPFYNEQKGKDLYPITSAILMDKRLQGNRVIQATNEAHELLPVSLSNGRANPESGSYITHKVMHNTLRRWLNIHDSKTALRYPLSDNRYLNVLHQASLKENTPHMEIA